MLIFTLKVLWFSSFNCYYNPQSEHTDDLKLNFSIYTKMLHQFKYSSQALLMVIPSLASWPPSDPIRTAIILLYTKLLCQRVSLFHLYSILPKFWKVWKYIFFYNLYLVHNFGNPFSLYLFGINTRYTNIIRHFQYKYQCKNKMCVVGGGTYSFRKQDIICSQWARSSDNNPKWEKKWQKLNLGQ